MKTRQARGENTYPSYKVHNYFRNRLEAIQIASETCSKNVLNWSIVLTGCSAAVTRTKSALIKVQNEVDIFILKGPSSLKSLSSHFPSPTEREITSTTLRIQWCCDVLIPSESHVGGSAPMDPQSGPLLAVLPTTEAKILYTCVRASDIFRDSCRKLHDFGVCCGFCVSRLEYLSGNAGLNLPLLNF